MQSNLVNPQDYIASLPADRKEVVERLHSIILENLPKGFTANIGYGMLGYSVPHSIYPEGYHCNPQLPLPFISLASQKNSINLYHMGIYSDPNLMNWFVKEFPGHTRQKLDMGMSCIRFKKLDDIPYQLIGELMKKMSDRDWVNMYEAMLKK